MPELILKRAGIERAGLRRPVGHGVLNVGEYGKHLGVADQERYFGQVFPNDLSRWFLPEQVRHFGQLLAQR